MAVQLVRKVSRVACVASSIAAVVLALVSISFETAVAAAEDPCEWVDSSSVGRLLGPTDQPESTTVEDLPACRIQVGPMSLAVLDAGTGDGVFDDRLGSYPPGQIQDVDDYVDGAFFGWRNGSLDFVATLDSQVTVVTVQGQSRSGDFDSSDPTDSSPEGQIFGSEVGSSMWVLMTEAFAVRVDVAAPTEDNLDGLWRTTDIEPCPPNNDLGVRVSEFEEDGGALRAIRVAGDSCLEVGDTDFEGTIENGSGTGASFGSVGVPSATGTAYELNVDSPTQVTLSGAAGTLQYTLVYERLSWPGLTADGVQSVLLGIPTPTEALTAKNVALTGAVSSLLLLIVVFPTTLFNSALEANLEKYTAFFNRLKTRLKPKKKEAGSEQPTQFWKSWKGVLAYVAVAGVLFSFMQPGWGFNSITLVSLIGFIGGIFLTSLLSVVASVVYLLFGHKNGRGKATVEPSTLAIAGLMVIASRIVGFVPGYMYGVLVGWDSEHEQNDFDRGRVIAFGSAITLIAAVVAWLLIPLCRDFVGEDGGVFRSIPLSLVGGVFVAGVEMLTIGLLPVRLLPGFTLKQHSPKAWAVLWGLSGGLFVLVLLRPGLVSGSSGSVFGTLILALCASGVAIIFWWIAKDGTKLPTEVAVGVPPPPPPEDAPGASGAI